jgi:hypothetical protein
MLMWRGPSSKLVDLAGEDFQPEDDPFGLELWERNLHELEPDDEKREKLRAELEENLEKIAGVDLD